MPVKLFIILMKPNKKHQTINSQTGVGLIEVLIALIVLSVGFLASANFQISSMRTNQQARVEAQALVLISDMMDRMRANPEGVRAGLYDNVSTSTLTAPACLTTSCTVTQLADADLFEWSANFESLRNDTNFVPVLPYSPDGSPAVGSVSAPVAGIYTVSVAWKVIEDAATVDKSFSVEFLP